MESQYSLRWNNYPSQLTEAFGSLLLEEDLVDVTLSCEGKKIKAHKMLLSACSPYFRDIFKENPCQHPVIVFKNVQYLDLKAIIEFMYCGEVNVFQEQLESFLNTAGILEVKGLTDQENEKEVNETIRRAKTGLEENKQPNLAKKQRLDKTKEPGFETVGNNSPPPKKMKSNVEIQPVGGSVPTEIGPIFVKEEVEDFDFIDENHAESEGSGRFSAEVPDPRSSPGINSGASKDIVEGLKEPYAERCREEDVECVSVGPSVKDESITTSPDIEIIESEPAVPIVKQKYIAKEEVPSKSGKNISGIKTQIPKTDPPSKTVVKSKVQIPKGLVVTPVKATAQVENLFDFPVQEPQVQDEALALRSEDATTPVHEEPDQYFQDISHGKATPEEQDSQIEPEIAEEAPVVQEQTVSGEPVEEKLEFDYFGCEICKSEGKSVDLDRITFNHKCPICPFCCFCAHLLKEHMKVIHGWFNVQRRFTQY